jgi:hypothetical protein
MDLCQQHGSVEGEYLGMLFDEPRPATARAEAVPPEPSAVIDAVGVHDDNAPQPSSPRTSLQPAPPASTPRTTGECLRLVVRHTQLDDDGSCTRPLPAQRRGRLPLDVSATLGPPLHMDQGQQRVETWLSTPSDSPTPHVDLRLALQQLVQPRCWKQAHTRHKAMTTRRE